MRLIFFILLFSLKLRAADSPFGLKQTSEVPIETQSVYLSPSPTLLAPPSTDAKARSPQSGTNNPALPQTNQDSPNLPLGNYADYAEYCKRNGWTFDPNIKIGCIKN